MPPWDRYAPPAEPATDGPWTRYRTQAPAQPEPPAAPERSTGEQAARLAGNFGAGFNDRLAGAVGAPFDLLNRGLRAVGVPIPEGSIADSLRGGINAVVGEPPVPENTSERVARGTGAGLVDAGTILVPALGVSRVAQTGGLAERTATAASALPGLQVASGVAGGAVGEATDNPYLGAAAALAAPVAAVGGARLITPMQNALSPGRAGLVAAAEREGIPLSTGQVTGSRTLQNMEAAMAQLPGTSQAEAAFGQVQREAFNRAALRRAGVDADNVSPEVLLEARGRIGGGIGEIANRNTLDVTPALNTRLTEIEDSLRFIPAEAAGPVRERIAQLRGMMLDPATEGGNQAIPGASYRMMDSALGRTARTTNNADLRAALTDLRQTLRTAMDGSISPDDAAAWQQLRREYANLMVIADASKGAGGAVAEGNISPLALRGALDRSTGGGYVWGQGDLNELARVGQSVLRAPPDSGTAGRSLMNGLLTGSMPTSGGIIGGAVGGVPGAIAGATAGFVLPSAVRAGYVNPLMTSYLRNQAVTPEAFQAITGLRRNVMLQQSAGALTD